MVQGSFQCISKKFNRSFKDVSGKIECHWPVSMEFVVSKGSFKGYLTKIKGCFESFLRVYKENFKGI